MSINTERYRSYLALLTTEDREKICLDIAKFGAHIFIENIQGLSAVFDTLTKEKRNHISNACAKMFSGYVGTDGIVDAIETY